MTLPRTLLRRICTASLSRAVRPIPLKLISVAKGTSSKDGTAFGNEWADKVRRYTQLQEILIKPNPMNTKDPTVAKVQEGERVLKSLNPGERLIVLDERGRDLKSEDFAKILAQASDEGWPAVVFAIGGPYGHAPEVRDRADDVVRLSSCVLNHAVARVVLLEQLYRGWTILRGEPYHH
jgi:23S rRNA (pseudouridine1915-N3)-methyltransferase